MRLHVDAAVQQPEADARHHRRARAGAAGQRFAGAALEHAQPDVRAVDHLHEARVHALRKTRVVLDLRALLGHGGGVDVVDHLHRVRVAHRQHRYGNDSAARAGAERQVPGLPAAVGLRVEPGRVEGHALGFEDGGAHVDRHAAVGAMRGSMTPASVCTRTVSLAVSLCSLTKRMKQRAPLPHCSTSPPSAL